MRAKIEASTVPLLTLAFFGLAGCFFISEAPPASIYTFLVIIIFCTHTLNHGAVAFLMGASVTLLGLFLMTKSGGALLVPYTALLGTLWGGLFLIQIHRQRIEEKKHRSLLTREELLKESRHLKQEIDFYKQREKALSTRSEKRRQLAQAAQELGSLLDPAAIQVKLVETAQRLFPGQEVQVSYAGATDAVSSYVTQKRQPVFVASHSPKGLPLMAVPITTQRAIAGVLKVMGGREVVYSRDDLRLLDILASLASLALDNSLLFRQVQENALRDNLTGLLTHRAFQDYLESAILEASRYGQPLSLIMADVDHFKKINDTHGHQTGDQILQGFAHILDRNVRDIDVVARYGGEEFVILLWQTAEAQALATAQQIREDLQAQEFDVGAKKIKVTASFGVASFPEDAKSGQQLIRQADQRLYQAKQAGRNRVQGKRA